MPITSIFLNLFITAIIFLFIPAIFIVMHKPMSRLKINLISFGGFIVGCIIMSLLFFITAQQNYPSFGGSLLWTLVGNFFMKKRLSLEVDPSDIRWQEKEKKRYDHMEKAIKDGKYASVEDMEKRQGVVGLVILGVLFLLITLFFFAF